MATADGEEVAVLAPRRARMRDPKRLSVLDSPSRKRAASSKKKRRVSTARDAAANDDDFVFTTKSRASGGGTKRKKGTTSDESDDDYDEEEKEMQQEQEDEEEEEEEEEEEVRHKKKKAKRAPRFPQLESVKVPAFAQSTAPDVALQAFFEAVMKQQARAVRGAFKGEFAFVATAAAKVGGKFVQDLPRTKAVDAARRARARTDSTFRNPRNAELARDKAYWADVQLRVSREMEAWRALKKTWEAAEAAATDDAAQQRPKVAADLADPSTLPSFLSEADRAFLAENCLGAARQDMPADVQDISMQGDALLSTLRKLASHRATAKKATAAVAAEVSASRQRLTGADTDAKDLIRGLIQ